MQITITKITAIINNTAVDKLILHTELPDGCWPFMDKATLRLEVAGGTAFDYCLKHFPTIPFHQIKQNQ